HSCVSGKIVNCNISGAARGIETFNSQSVTIDSCALGGPGTPASIGIVAGNATTVIATDVTGWGTGLRHHNAGLIVHGGRFEVNNVGIEIGVDDKGNVFQSTRLCMLGVSAPSWKVSPGIDVSGFIQTNCLRPKK